MPRKQRILFPVKEQLFNREVETRLNCDMKGNQQSLLFSVADGIVAHVAMSCVHKTSRDRKKTEPP